LLAVVLSSCKGTSSALKSKDLKKESIKNIVSNYSKSLPDFKTMRGRLKCEYDDGYSQQNVNISYRFKKDEVLWMSAKLAGLIQLAKMKITPGNIQFYERIDQSFFDGDFKLVSSFLGIELDYDQIQNLLLGYAIKPVDFEKSDLLSLDESFQISTVYENGISQVLLVDAKTFKLQQQILIKDNKRLMIDYSKYQMVDNMSFPEEFMVIADDSKDKVSLNLSYKNISLNDDLRFPFRIPNDFKPLKFE
jgi:hypothetical protein